MKLSAWKLQKEKKMSWALFGYNHAIVTQMCFSYKRHAKGYICGLQIQLNLHETDLLFRYLSHHLTWHCSSISENLQRFARNLLHKNAKLFLLLFSNRKYGSVSYLISCKDIFYFTWYPYTNVYCNFHYLLIYKTLKTNFIHLYIDAKTVNQKKRVTPWAKKFQTYVVRIVKTDIV